jgi:hypothetical protein
MNAPCASKRLTGGTLALLLFAACAPSVPTAFAAARDRATRAYAHGRYLDAAQAWVQAAQVAERRHDRLEADERAAASFARAGDSDNARARLLAVMRDTSSRDQAARVTFQLAELERVSNPAEAEKRYTHLLETYPEAPAAPQALRRVLRGLEAARGTEAALDRALELERRLGQSALGEPIGYYIATKLDELDRSALALPRFLALADKYPYPTGVYWDDALWHAAEIRRRSGDPNGAIALLERMLRERESADVNGSYERPRYEHAAFAIAEIARDDLHDIPRARAAFRRLTDEFPESRLRDDAIWNEALLLSESTETAGVCSLMAELARKAPDSRYVACSRELCPSAVVPAGRRCHAYLVRDSSESQPSESAQTDATRSEVSEPEAAQPEVGN